MLLSDVCLTSVSRVHRA